jgi:hypothetical protein
MSPIVTLFIGLFLGVWAAILVCHRWWWYNRWKTGFDIGYKLGKDYGYANGRIQTEHEVYRVMRDTFNKKTKCDTYVGKEAQAALEALPKQECQAVIAAIDKLAAGDMSDTVEVYSDASAQLGCTTKGPNRVIFSKLDNLIVVVRIGARTT